MQKKNIHIDKHYHGMISGSFFILIFIGLTLIESIVSLA
jgi:hypothetical protein